MSHFSRELKAHEFPEGAEWLNVDRPLALEDLRGKIVLLDFWTYCCINCMHVIPDLKRLEAEFPELVVIGVHSAKFANEQVRDNIRHAILRYELEHPVVVDNDFALWRAYGIRAWRATNRAEARQAIAEARGYDGPAFIEFQVAQEGEDGNVYPMVPSGAALDDMIRRPVPEKVM